MNNNNLKTSLTLSETITITSMLFGMFFGAGNLIFPVYMGQMAGSNVWPAIIGFIITGVGLPLLGVAALGISKSNGLQELSSKVSKRYGVFFTCALYLTIGPLFAIPRCATVPFEAGVVHTVGSGVSSAVALAEKMDVKVCDCYKEWKKLSETQDITYLFQNTIRKLVLVHSHDASQRKADHAGKSPGTEHQRQRIGKPLCNHVCHRSPINGGMTHVPFQ